MAEGPQRRGFWPVALVGLAAAALTGVSSGKPWMRAPAVERLLFGVRAPDRTADMPLALALSLVVLAGWGALLVTRGTIRRIVAAVAALAAVGVVACVAIAPFALSNQLREDTPDQIAVVHVTITWWYLAAALASLLSVVASVVAFKRVPEWPTMGSRYDAPAGPSTAPSTPAPVDLWRALDQGHDPTDPQDPYGPASP